MVTTLLSEPASVLKWNTVLCVPIGTWQELRHLERARLAEIRSGSGRRAVSAPIVSRVSFGAGYGDRCGPLSGAGLESGSATDGADPSRHASRGRRMYCVAADLPCVTVHQRPRPSAGRTDVLPLTDGSAPTCAGAARCQAADTSRGRSYVSVSCPGITADVQVAAVGCRRYHRCPSDHDGRAHG